jgi:predicted RNase H-like HicB family nuclease
VSELELSVTFSARLPFKLIKRKKWVVASCPILDVHSQGDTKEKAKKNLVEALSLFFLSCFERGTLDSVLKKCGFSPKKSYLTKQAMPSTKDYIDVPIPFLVRQSNHTRCHA